MISDHVSYEEVVKSKTAIRNGIDNTPNEKQLKNIKLLCEFVIEPLRELAGNRAIFFASFFRCDDLNTIIGGAMNSQHMALKGAACDIDQDFHENCASNRELFDLIKDNLNFDQLIWEFGDDENPDWVHISFNVKNNRGEILKALKNENGKTQYIRI